MGSEIFFVAACCGAKHCVAVCYSVLQCVAELALRRVNLVCRFRFYGLGFKVFLLQHVPVQSSVLQCVAVCCGTCLASSLPGLWVQVLGFRF